MVARSCPSCGSSDLTPGWIGDGANMVALWEEGTLRRHLLGAPELGARELEVQAYRCGECGHLSLFAAQPE